MYTVLWWLFGISLHSNCIVALVSTEIFDYLQASRLSWSRYVYFGMTFLLDFCEYINQCVYIGYVYTNMIDFIRK